MGDKRSFNDAFAPRKPQGTDGFARVKTPETVRTPAGKAAPTDAFKPAPKPAKAAMIAKPARAEPPKDAFARKAQKPATVETPKPAKVEAPQAVRVKSEAKMQRPSVPPKVIAPKPEVALKPVQQSGAKLPPLVRASEPPPAKIPPLVAQPVAKQPAMVRAEPAPKPRNLFGRSGGEPKAKQRALTPSEATRASRMTSPPKREGGKVPAMAFAAAGAALPKPRGGAGYNPFDRRRFVKSPTPPVEEAIASPASAPEPFLDLPPMEPAAPLDLSPAAPEPRRAPLHVVPSAAPVDAVSKPKAGGAARSSSLVLVSGARSVAAAEAANPSEAPPAEKPAEKLAEKPAEAAPTELAPAAAAAPAAAEPAPQAEVKRRGGGGGGGDGGARPPARAVAHRGFNQDDMFGVIFGIAVIAFLLMWFMRGKNEEAVEDGTLFAAQSAPVQRLAVSPTPPVPAPLPPADPFGQGPVDLKPQGPVLEALPPPPESAEVAPTTPPPAVAAKPAPAPVESTLPLAERKMHAWFCTASTRLTKAARTDLGGELDKFAQVFAGKELVVRGYADTRGSLESNTELGGNRADVVADFLRTKGLTVVDVQGVGELNGLDDNQNCPNQRRVDVWVKGGPAETPSRACAPEPDVEALVCG